MSLKLEIAENAKKQACRDLQEVRKALQEREERIATLLSQISAIQSDLKASEATSSTKIDHLQKEIKKVAMDTMHLDSDSLLTQFMMCFSAGGFEGNSEQRKCRSDETHFRAGEHA